MLNALRILDAIVHANQETKVRPYHFYLPTMLFLGLSAFLGAGGAPLVTFQAGVKLKQLHDYLAQQVMALFGCLNQIVFPVSPMPWAYIIQFCVLPSVIQPSQSVMCPPALLSSSTQKYARLHCLQMHRTLGRA